MKRAILILILIAFSSCETAEQKEKRVLRDMVFDSEYLLNGLEEVITYRANVRLAKAKVINVSKFIKDYNDDLGYAFGYSKNIDTIEAYLNKKNDLYHKYLVSDAYWWFSRDSTERVKYKTEKDSILKLL